MPQNYLIPIIASPFITSPPNKNKTIFNDNIPFVVCCGFSDCIGVPRLSINTVLSPFFLYYLPSSCNIFHSSLFFFCFSFSRIKSFPISFPPSTLLINRSLIRSISLLLVFGCQEVNISSPSNCAPLKFDAKYSLSHLVAPVLTSHLLNPPLS